MTDGFDPVFVFSKDISNFITFGFFLFCTIIAIYLPFSIFRVRANRTRPEKLLSGVIGCFVCAIVACLAFNSFSDAWQQYARLSEIYNRQQYTITQGMVHVLRTQPPQGHRESNDGDVIQVGNRQFKIDHFQQTLGYHRTIAYGGALQEGKIVKIYHNNGLILRIDVKRSQASSK